MFSPSDRFCSEQVRDETETERLLAGSMYKCGLSVSSVADRCEVRHGTIYRWFDRFEERPIRDAITDDRHWTTVVAGRSAFERFESAVNDPLGESGHEQLAWSTALVQRLLRDESEAEHSQRHL